MAYSQNKRDVDLECDCEYNSGNVLSLRDNIVEMDRNFRKLKIPSTSLDSAYSSNHSATFSSVDVDDKTSVSSFTEIKSDLACIPEAEVDICFDESVSKASCSLLSHQNEEGDR